MELTATAAAVFLIAAAPICLFVAFSDLARMKIPNLATDALLIAYAVLGLIVLPFNVYLWGYGQFVVMLLVGILLNAAGAMGAGDSKFIASAAPYVAIQDLQLVALILTATFLASYVTHRLAKHTPLRNLVPHWQSWDQTRRFPMGFPLAAALVAYLGLVAFLR